MTVDKQRLRNTVGSCLLERDGFPDTLAIALCTYFEDHMERPKNDPETDNGWGEWVERKTNEALDLLTDEVLRLTQTGGERQP